MLANKCIPKMSIWRHRDPKLRAFKVGGLVVVPTWWILRQQDYFDEILIFFNTSSNLPQKNYTDCCYTRRWASDDIMVHSYDHSKLEFSSWCKKHDFGSSYLRNTKRDEDGTQSKKLFLNIITRSCCYDILKLFFRFSEIFIPNSCSEDEVFPNAQTDSSTSIARSTVEILLPNYNH